MITSIKDFLIGLCVCCSLACHTQRVEKPNGFVVAKIFYYDYKTSSFAVSETDLPSTRTWFYDSVVIQERLGIRGYTSVDGVYKRWLDTIGYTLIDLRKGWFYHYKTFTDTASLVAKWEQSDTASFFKHGMAWTFYLDNSGVRPAENPVPLPDTVRNGITYRRLTFPVRHDNGTETRRIAYFRCDRKGSLFQYHRALSRKMGCPLTRIEVVPEGVVQTLAIAQEVEFVRDSLTAIERNVFAAWEQNVKNNPVE